MTFITNSMFVIHLLSGVFIGGTAFLLYWFIAPSVRELGPDGGKFMVILLGKFKLPVWMSWIGVFNITSGFYLLYIKYGNDTAWITSSSGFPLLIGILTGLTAWTLATFVFQRPAGKQIVQIGSAIKAAGGTPTPIQLQELDIAKRKMAIGTKLTVILITMTIIGMSLSLHL